MMTVREFCLKKTQVNELCAIRDSGWIIATVWVDHEDLFSIDKRVSEMEVKSDVWGTLSIVTEHGDKISVPCHYIDC